MPKHAQASFIDKRGEARDRISEIKSPLLIDFLPGTAFFGTQFWNK